MAILSGNRLGILLGFFCVATVFLFWDTSAAIWGLWMSDNNPTYSHGPLLLLVSIYLIYRECRNNGERLNLKISYLGLMCVVGSGLLWFLAGLGSVQIIQMLSIVTLLTFIFVTMLGYRQAKPYLFPVLLMIGALPVWEVFSYYLQLNSAVIAGWLTTLTITPSIREGMLIHIPAGTFEVETGCSGLAYFIVSVIISLLFVYDQRIPLRRALLFVLAAMAVAIVANIVRVYVIILSGQLTDMESYFITDEHVSLGWAIFAIGISVYLWLASRLISVNGDYDKGARPVAEEKSIIQPSGPSVLAVALLAIAVLIGPLASEVYSDNTQLTQTYSVHLPNEISDWKKSPYVGVYRPKFQKGDATEEAAFIALGQDANIYMLVNYFYRQTQNAEAVSDMNRLTSSREWSRIDSQTIDPGMEGFSDVGETILRSRNGEEKLVWHWYKTHQFRTNRNWAAKLLNIMDILRGQPSIYMVVLAIEAKSGIENAREQLRAFSQKIKTKIKIEPLS